MSSKGFEALNEAIKSATAKAGEQLKHVPKNLTKGRTEVKDEAPPICDLASHMLMAYAIAEGANVCQITSIDHGGITLTFRVTCELVDIKASEGEE